MEGPKGNIDERIKKYVKRHKSIDKNIITENNIREAIGEAYDLINNNDVSRAGVEVCADDITRTYTAIYKLNIDNCLYNLTLDMKLNEENNIVDLKYVNLALIS